MPWHMKIGVPDIRGDGGGCQSGVNTMLCHWNMTTACRT